jgi:beta-glucosidase
MKSVFNDFWNRRRLLASSVLIMTCAVAASAAGPSARQKLSPTEINRQVDTMITKLNLEQKIELLGVGQDGSFFRAMPILGLPSLKMSDASMGVRTWGPSIAYAAGIGLAASWDVNLARKIGVSQGRDSRGRGVHILLGPGVNIYRMPMDGRNFEFMGEDPYLAGQLAAQYILGVQSQSVVAMVKHYVANNLEYDRHNENSMIDERTMREIYLPAFEAAVKDGRVGSVMDSYNLVNGEHSTQNKFLNVEVLRKEWGFRGILMSDYGATYNGVAAANAGLDVEDPVRYMGAKTLLPAIKSGKVSMATINEKVRHLLYVAVKFGFINHDQTDLHIPLYSRRSLAVALQSARESMVLLKNEDNLLPLDMDHVHTVAVIGPDSYPAVASAGGSAHVTAIDPVSFMTGLSDAYSPGTKVYWNRGVKDLPTIFEASHFSVDPDGNHLGLKREAFLNGSFRGSPLSERTVDFVDHWSGDQWSLPSPIKHAYRYWGYYTPKVSGPERFITAAVGGDAYRLYVNGKLVLKQTPHEGQVPHYVDINLPAGRPASVRFDYLPETDQVRAGLGVLPPSQMLEPNVRKVAAMVDVVVLCVGFNPRTEGEGHDRTYTLPPGQVELIKAVAAANPHTIVVLTAGGSVATSGWLDRVPVFLQTWYGGSEAGRALAEVLAGKVDPSGKLPITWWKRVQDNPAYKNYYEEPGTHDVKYREGIFLGYRAYGRPGQPAPLFPFGYGLSYTRFAFSHLSVTPKEASPDGPITVRFEVQNVGNRAGAEVAEVYVGDPSATVPMPQKQLKGFERVMLKPGQSKEVSVTLNRRSLAYWSVKSHGWRVDPGKFVAYVGDSSEHVPLQANFTVE